MRRSASPIVITGGAQRLGLAAALALHDEIAPVVITYRTERPQLELLRERGIETLRAEFDGGDATLAFADALRQRYVSLRAIIHNASEWVPEGGSLPDAEVLRRMLDVHVAAPYLINLACGDLLRRHGEAHGLADIIHLSDYVAGTGSKKHTAYAASKAALDNLTLSFASKYAPLVKVNSIAPALLMFRPGDDSEYRSKAQRKSLLEAAPGEAEGVEAIRFLLQSRYLTGKTIALDGGRHLAQAS